MFCVKIPGQNLKIYLAAILLLPLFIPGNLLAANNVDIKSESIIRFLERDTPSENDALVVPAYEYLQLDIGRETLSFHANGWGRIDLTDNDFLTDQTTGKLLYGYLEYRPEGKNFYSRLGRQAIFAGVANESVDGIYLDAALPSAMALSLYFGQPVALDSTNGRDGDSIYGGRFSLRQSNLDLGLSYKLIENDSNDAEEMAGVDYGLLLGNIFISGLSSYNLITEDFAEHSFDAVLSAEENSLRLFYQLFTFEDYFGTGANNANPFRVLALTSEELASYGIEMTRGIPTGFEFGIKITRNDYDLEEASHYAAILANWNNDSTSYGGEFGISEGENGRNDMMIARGYIATQMTENKLLDQLSLDLLYALYDQSIFGEDTSLFASISGTRKVSENLLLKLSADYESNPYYDSDIRGLASLVYNYSAN
jgi:hypothetical protein